MKKLILISGPSGSGKSTIIDKILKDYPECKLSESISYTTREMRPGEVNGQHYHFVSDEKFDDMVCNDEFAEWANVYGKSYGTAIKDIESILVGGNNAITAIDWQGARSIRKRLPVKTVFVCPPSMDILRDRLISRNPLDTTIDHRLAFADSDMSHKDEYDLIVVNDNLDRVVAEIAEFICND